MSDKPTDLRHKVQAWLTSSGYPLEMYSHKKLLQYGFICEKSPLYTDVESGAKREIDILGEKSYGTGSKQHGFVINLLVECKKSKYPLVVLSSGPELSSVREEIYGARTWPAGPSNASVLANAGFELKISSNDDTLPFSRQVYPGYSMVQALKDSDEVVHKAMFGLAKAEHYFERQHEELFAISIADKDNLHILVGLYISVLVVEAPLFNAYLDGTKVSVEETNWASVTLNLPWTPRPDSERQANIQIVTRDFLEVFLRELEVFGKWFGESDAIRQCAKGVA